MPKYKRFLQKYLRPKSIPHGSAKKIEYASKTTYFLEQKQKELEYKKHSIKQKLCKITSKDYRFVPKSLYDEIVE